jgi:hypothetical protein
MTTTVLQRHAAKGNYVEALEAIFSGESSSSNDASGGGSDTLSSKMEVVDAVLRLAADAASSNEGLR